jgi:hypothetical protein
LFVDTDSRINGFGTEMLIYKTLLDPRLIAEANQRFNLGLDMDFWQHPEEHVQVHYIFLDNLKGMDAYFEIERVSPADYLRLNVTEYTSQRFDEVGWIWQSIDQITKVNAIEDRLNLNSDGTVSVVGKEVYGPSKTRFNDYQRRSLHEMQYAGLVMGTLEYLKSQGKDVDQEADAYLSGLQRRLEEIHKNAVGVDAAMDNGGIDLTPDKMPLEVKQKGEGIQFKIDPAQIEQMKNSSGLTPVIINILPLKNLHEFLNLP